jgi:hypothetical protein
MFGISATPAARPDSSGCLNMKKRQCHNIGWLRRSGVGIQMPPLHLSGTVSAVQTPLPTLAGQSGSSGCLKIQNLASKGTVSQDLLVANGAGSRCPLSSHLFTCSVVPPPLPTPTGPGAAHGAFCTCKPSFKGTVSQIKGPVARTFVWQTEDHNLFDITKYGGSSYTGTLWADPEFVVEKN